MTGSPRKEKAKISGIYSGVQRPISSKSSQGISLRRNLSKRPAMDSIDAKFSWLGSIS